MAWIAEQVLQAIAAARARDCITWDKLTAATGLTRRQVQESCRKLVAAGLLVKTEAGCHRLTSAGVAAIEAGARYRSGPKDATQPGRRIWQDTTRIRIWRAIRIRRKFTVPEIVSLVAGEEMRGDPTSNVQKYLRVLTRAGYLIELPRREAGSAPTSNGYKRWWLQDCKDTGPQAPVWRPGRRAVYDPNTGQEVAL